MATVTKPIALDESLNTTELAPRNVADVLAEELAKISGAISHIALPTTYDELSDLEDVNISSPTNGQYLQYDSVTQKWKNVNGGGGGGDSVAWSQIVTTGTKIAEITINGTTTNVYAPQGGGSFSATIIVTTTTGLTVTATKGADSYTATETSSGTYEVTVDSAGTWTISDGSNTDTVNVTAQTTYYVTLSSIPDGSTVTPTDVIQTWLHCANIWDKAYTTIGEVLADSTTLSALISSSNAVDYMVRSTTWASSVCADSSAMTYIGLNNYCANTLIADSTWRSAIIQSDYRESVCNVKAPPMTGTTTPSGEVIFSEEIISAGWKAFDGDWSKSLDYNNKKGWSTDHRTNQYIGYDFGKSVKFVGYSYRDCVMSSTYYGIVTYKTQYYDGNDWVDSTSELTNTNHSTRENKAVETVGTGTKMRMYIVTATYGMNASATNIQFYGREDV